MFTCILCTVQCSSKLCSMHEQYWLNTSVTNCFVPTRKHYTALFRLVPGPTVLTLTQSRFQCFKHLGVHLTKLTHWTIHSLKFLTLWDKECAIFSHLISSDMSLMVFVVNWANPLIVYVCKNASVKWTFETLHREQLL